MTQNIASYKLQMFCTLQVLQCLGFAVWVLRCLVSLVWAICITNNNNCALCNLQPLKICIAPLTNYIAPYLLSKQQRNYTTKKEMQINFVHVLWCIVPPHFKLQVTFNFQSLTILKWKHKEQKLCCQMPPQAHDLKKIDQKFSKPNMSLEKMQEFSIINSFTFKVL
jgi:hypothetical protein